MEFYSLLISHVFILIPILTSYFVYSKNKDGKIIFILINIIINIFFSFLYHFYHYNINFNILDYDKSTKIDSLLTNTNLFINIIYLLNFKNIYLLSYSYIYLIIILFLSIDNVREYIIYLTITICFISSFIKYKIVYFYFKEFFIFSIIFILNLLLCFLFDYFDDYNYNLLHSIWHILAHLEISLLIILKYKLDCRINNLKDEIIYSRTSSLSI
jgi:hypothetical protein